MNFEFTAKDMQEMLESPVGNYTKIKLCVKCDHFDSVGHAGIKCNKCGGDMASVEKWLVINLLNRVKPIPSRGEMWLPAYVTYFVMKKTGGQFGDIYSWACNSAEIHKTLFREYKQAHP